MKNIKKIIIAIIIIVILICLGLYVFNNFIEIGDDKEIIEYTPEEEISDEQMRQTIVTLYFYNTDTKQIEKEGHTIDARLLLDNTYEKIINMLIQGPKSSKLKTLIPSQTKINNAWLEGDIVYIDFSKEFIENHEGGAELENATINIIVNSLSELNEVNGIKILIDGEANMEFKDGLVNFKDVFLKI